MQRKRFSRCPESFSLTSEDIFSDHALVDVHFRKKNNSPVRMEASCVPDEPVGEVREHLGSWPNVCSNVFPSHGYHSSHTFFVDLLAIKVHACLRICPTEPG